MLDLRDQVVEVWDARGLASATWSFTYDYAKRPLKTVHSTAAGTRYALPDAANNAIWSRDARGIEVDRTFDALNRPLTEESDDGTTVKLRRKWTYLAYDPMHADFATYQSKNLFGRVEEERDADGLRFFEYDWRGLVTKVSHKFWSLKDGSARDWDNASSDLWSTGDAWDPAVPSTARGSISDWLELDDLTDTTTVAVSTTFDAAGRPTEVTWPEGLKLRSTWNAAGLLSKLEVDRGTGAGYFDAMTNAAYNARGQLTSHTSGNGAVTTRTYDDDLERLVRLVTSRSSGGSTTDFQDLGYDYDPAGNPVQLTDNLATSSYRANQVIPNTRTFRYDPRYRLVRATGKKHRTVGDKSVNPLVASPDNKDYEPYTFRYSYDAVGNFTTNQEYAHGTNTLNYKATRLDLFNGDAGEATSTDPTLGNFRYDENGNTTKTPRITQLAYTMDNQARYADLGGGGQVRYLRHGDQRVVRLVNKTGVKALGVYLGPFEYHQRQGSTAYTKVVLHVSGAVGRVAQVERVLAGIDPDSLSVFYAHGDHLGSAQVLTKSDGTLLSQEEYFPYGRSSDRRDARNRYRFIGVETDEDTGLCMTGPRTYDPVSGRFLQVDPVRKPERSPYEYAGGRVAIVADPSGYDEPEVSKPALKPPTSPPRREAVGELDPGSVRALGPWADVFKGQLEAMLNPKSGDPGASTIGIPDLFHLHFSLPDNTNTQSAQYQALKDAARAVKSASAKAKEALLIVPESLRSDLLSGMLANGELGAALRTYVDAFLTMPGATITYHSYEYAQPKDFQGHFAVDSARRLHQFPANSALETAWPRLNDDPTRAVTWGPQQFPGTQYAPLTDLRFWRAPSGKVLVAPFDASVPIFEPKVDAWFKEQP